MQETLIAVCSACGEELPCMQNGKGECYCSIHCKTLLKHRSRRERTMDLVDMFDPQGQFQTAIRQSLVGF